jgi:hypothetical protein
MVNISAIVLEIGVPVAKTTPPPRFFVWMCCTFRKRSNARSEAVCGRPATRVILVT